MEQAERVVALITEVTGTELAGAYLHGSAVLGGLRPASDVDILAVTRRSLTEDQRRALIAGLLPISGSAVGARPVELTVVVQAAVRPWRYPPTGDFRYGEWLRADYEAGLIPAPEPMPGLALEAAVALAGDRTLAGLPPAQVLDPVPTELLFRAGVDGIPGLLADLAEDTRNVLLTLARIWTTLATGTIVAKDTAADWALARLAPEHRPVLAFARDLYLTTSYADESWSDELKAQVGPHVDAVLARIGGLRDAGRQ
ncbi:aminoglycoside adenylyltransferase domain-containing protein [Actinoplanes auranticolor]|uniref:Nucleotidyltransferase n=1 Tax=Actinoplanes auranticolor TaxID=47988 RepID=A0A919VHX1_9ACTN|nr:aminoglycoside adenylyltransferase domain-containing protein [Actinoplanes auranticolor]GIM62915.1 nucleotidyltransferase [Actinoplanes auranticolor]